MPSFGCATVERDTFDRQRPHPLADRDQRYRANRGLRQNLRHSPRAGHGALDRFRDALMSITPTISAPSCLVVDTVGLGIVYAGSTPRCCLIGRGPRPSGPQALSSRDGRL